MRKVTCAECGKHYDYDVDAFCPGCGAYNRPAKGGGVSRVDGIREEGHENSFLHQEFHSEKRSRQNSPLEQSGRGGVSQIRLPEQGRSSAQRPEREERSQNLSGAWKIIVYIILGLVIFFKIMGK